MRSIEPGISRFRVWSFGPSRNDGATERENKVMTIRTKFVNRATVVLVLSCHVLPAHAQQLPADFVYLRDIDPTIIQDIRYATANNFTGRRLAGYDAAECVVKRELGLRLKAVQQ